MNNFLFIFFFLKAKKSQRSDLICSNGQSISQQMFCGYGVYCRMDIKYALADCLTDNTVHICELSQLKHNNMTQLNSKTIHKWGKSEEAYVSWKKSSSDELEL